MNKMSKMNTLLMVLVLVLGLSVSAQAVTIRADYTLNFLPPSPCYQTELGDLSGYTLGGTLALFYQLGRSGDLVEVQPGPPNIGGIACGASGAGTFVFDLDLAEPVTLFLSFGGDLVSPNPGPPDMPVYAFPAGTEGNPEQPEAAPLINLGTISVGTQPGPPQMPLYAFASPGREVGTLSVSFAQVPEPGTLALMLMGIALGGLMMLLRRDAA